MSSALRDWKSQSEINMAAEVTKAITQIELLPLGEVVGTELGLLGEGRLRLILALPG